ncbi:glutamate--tRNA ligase family protein [Halobacteriovorax marinus]|uniref:glutamate--tRNA ligase family protein n=1 Tax=Halobacteriovorax marinus TaxID=97084 RepID=UPI0002E2DD43|nr:glutamate--tRNA ligase family protein [Halobacteriovorax marinus]
MRTRIAPTPNGHLHLGNIFNFIYTAYMANKKGLELGLRIDDHDHIRCKDIYIEEVFEAIKLLEIDIDFGPKNLRDFKNNFSQAKKHNEYWDFLKGLERKFNCECSRKKIFENNEQGLYPGFCKNKEISFVQDLHAIRYNSPNTSYHFDGKEISIQRDIGDIILWRKDNIPSYQLVSIYEDFSDKVTHIFRGEDLLTSSAIQIALANDFGLSTFPKIENFSHHSLVIENGEKLSKSRHSDSVMEALREDPSIIYLLFSEFMTLQPSENLSELISKN